jgi:hypothetical protein
MSTCSAAFKNVYNGLFRTNAMRLEKGNGQKGNFIPAGNFSSVFAQCFTEIAVDLDFRKLMMKGT